jgi:type I restriction enzyme S subunit
MTGGWPLIPLRRLFGVRRGGTPTKDPANWGGPHVWLTPEDLSRHDGERIGSSRRSLTDRGVDSCSAIVSPVGSLVLSSRAPIGYVVETTRPAATNQGCMTLVPKAELHAPYFRYQLLASRQHIEMLGQGSTFKELASASLLSLSLVAPPLDVQRRVADFLDRETARIDALIERKDRLRRLVRERTVLRADEVTWFQAVSEIPLMHAVDPSRPVMYGIVLPGPDVPEGIPIVKGGDVSAQRLTPAALARTTPEIEAPYARARLVADDMLFAIRGGVGDVAAVPAELEGANITQDVARIAPRAGWTSEWLLTMLRTATFQRRAARLITGATIRGINIRDLERIPIPLASQERQEADLAQLRPLLAASDQLVERLNRQVLLLREHRQALITSAVTGQLDISA